MNNLHYAVAALQFLRNRRMYSINVHPRIEPGRPIKVVLAEHLRQDKVLTRLRKVHPVQSRRCLEGKIAYGAAVLAAGVGNCGELASACGWYLYTQHCCRGFSIVTYPKGDHSFVALGQDVHSSGYFPPRFADWNQDAVICDPWADIACLARDYPARWRARMSNWQIMHRDINGKRPLSPCWYNMVDRSKAELFMFPAGTG